MYPAACAGTTTWEALPRFFHPEGAIFSEKIALTPFEIEMEIPVTEEMAKVVHGLEGIPGGIGKSPDHPERGVVPEQLAPIRAVELDPEPLVSEVVAGIIPRLEGNGVPACRALNLHERHRFTPEDIGMSGSA